MPGLRAGLPRGVRVGTGQAFRRRPGLLQGLRHLRGGLPPERYRDANGGRPMKRVMEGSRAVAEMVQRCRPQVISAYPITPQTHIVENLAEMVANGELSSEFVNVESEFSAASVVLGASATGARAF